MTLPCKRVAIEKKVVRLLECIEIETWAISGEVEVNEVYTFPRLMSVPVSAVHNAAMFLRKIFPGGPQLFFGKHKDRITLAAREVRASISRNERNRRRRCGAKPKDSVCNVYMDRS